MQKYSTFLFVPVAFGIGIVSSLYFVETKVEYVNIEKTPDEIIIERTLSIMDSEEFNAEMRSLATARALYQLSNEKQGVAVELAEKALMSYQNSQSMAQKWTSDELTN